MEVVKLTDIPSTNDYLLGLNTDRDICAVTDYQSAGKGMDTNTWESERGKNLLFSLLVHPTWLPIQEQYLMSMAEALALYDAIRAVHSSQFTVHSSGVHSSRVKEGLTIKWPNDIYWGDRKLSGTRIDANLQGGMIRDMIIGTGINVNQTTFSDKVPNPVSLKQITNKTYDVEELLDTILANFNEYHELLRSGGKGEIMRQYHEKLYRREGFHRYEDGAEEFEAELVEVSSNGIMTLRRKDGILSSYEFKEVRFVMK